MPWMMVSVTVKKAIFLASECTGAKIALLPACYALMMGVTNHSAHYAYQIRWTKERIVHAFQDII